MLEVFRQSMTGSLQSYWKSTAELFCARQESWRRQCRLNNKKKASTMMQTEEKKWDDVRGKVQI